MSLLIVISHLIIFGFLTLISWQLLHMLMYDIVDAITLYRLVEKMAGLVKGYNWCQHIVKNIHDFLQTQIHFSLYIDVL